MQPEWLQCVEHLEEYADATFDGQVQDGGETNAQVHGVQSRDADDFRAVSCVALCCDLQRASWAAAESQPAIAGVGHTAHIEWTAGR